MSYTKPIDRQPSLALAAQLPSKSLTNNCVPVLGVFPWPSGIAPALTPWGVTVPAKTMTRKARTKSPDRSVASSDFALRLRKAVTSADGTIDVAKLWRLAVDNGVWDERYAKLSNGLARMSIGNKLRALVRRGGKIKWGRGVRLR